MRIDPAAQQKFQKQSEETGKATSTATTYYGSKLQTAYSGRIVSRQTTSGLLGNVATRIDASRLSNLKENLGFLAQSGVATSKAEQLVGSGAPIGKRVHGLSDLFGSNSTRDHAGQLLGPVGGGLAGRRNQQLSDEPSAGTVSPEKFTWEWFRDVVLNRGKSKVSTGPNQVVGPALTILTANTDSPEDKANEFRGWATILRMKRGEYAALLRQRGGVDPDPTSPDEIPNPEADTGRTRHILPEHLRGIAARLSANVTPNPEANPASFGPVNVAATTLGVNAQLAEFVNDPEALTRLTPEQTKELEARLSKYILRVKEL